MACRTGALVTVSDMADETSLANSLRLLADVPIAAMRLGGHREEDFRRADLVVVNPAVRPNSPWLQFARDRGARLCTELELLIENCPARLIGVTGSNGKSTTAAMIASILSCDSPAHIGSGTGGESVASIWTMQNKKCKLQNASCRSLIPNPQSPIPLPTALSQKEKGRDTAQRRAFLGGNIGGSLLSNLPQMTPDDWVVLEISSFQLWHFSPAVRMPHVAVVTGCSPNHLDWHATFADYAAAKRRILTGQTPDDVAVLNTLDAEVASWLPAVRGRQIPISLDDLPSLSAPGEHNRINAACAAAAAKAAGCGDDEIRRGLAAFPGLPQRLEQIAVVAGRRFYNDSSATTPEFNPRRAAIARWADLALGGRKEQGVRSGAACGGNRPPCARRRPSSDRSGGNCSKALPRRMPTFLARPSKPCGRRSTGVGSDRGRAKRSCCRRPAQHRPVPELPPARRTICGIGPPNGHVTVFAGSSRHRPLRPAPRPARRRCKKGQQHRQAKNRVANRQHAGRRIDEQQVVCPSPNKRARFVRRSARFAQAVFPIGQWAENAEERLDNHNGDHYQMDGTEPEVAHARPPPRCRRESPPSLPR